MLEQLRKRIQERTYALGGYRSWRSKGGGRNSFPDHELHWVVAMFARSSEKDKETAQAVERSNWFDSDGSVRSLDLDDYTSWGAALDTVSGRLGC